MGILKSDSAAPSKSRKVLHLVLMLWAIACLAAYGLNTMNIAAFRYAKGFSAARHVIISAAEFMQSLTYRDYKWK